MNKELIENRKWLEECQEAFKHLRATCCDADDNIMVDEQLNKHIVGLFPIFNEIPDFYAYFSYQSGDPFSFGGIFDVSLTLYIEFDDSYSSKVYQWFDESLYQNYGTGKTSLNASQSVIEFEVSQLIKNLIQKQIKELHNQLESDCAKSADDNYLDICLDEDPHYLGVRFLVYSGEYPTYCNGNFVFEVEGERVVLSSSDVWDTFGGVSEYNLLKNCDLGRYERYRNEFVRLIKENIDLTCCGGCE